LRKALLAALCLALLLAGAGAILCENTLRVPRRPAPANPAPMVQLRATDGAVLKAWFLTPPAHPAGCVILLHGIADSRESGLGLAAILVQEGYAVLLPDSRAHGESGGELVTYGLLEKTDVLGWADWLRNAGCSRIFGLGESLGAAILIQAAAERPAFDAIVAECPFSNLRAIAAERVVQFLGRPTPLWRSLAPAFVQSAAVYAQVRYGIDIDGVSPLAAARHLRTPLLLIHGLEDRNIAPWHSRALAGANANATLWLVPGAGHTNASAVDPAEFRRRVLEWFARH
jgi:hypothetical protein